MCGIWKNFKTETKHCGSKKGGGIQRMAKRQFLKRNSHRPFNPLTPNDLYISRTAPLTSKRRILYIYSTNVGTEYFKHALYSPFFFSLQNAVCFITLTS